MVHPAYQRILTLGGQAVPHLLRTLPRAGVPFIAALEAITGETRRCHEKAVKLMVGDWINWGKVNGVV